MSNLEELIERLCPDGVEYKTLGDVATISRGGNLVLNFISRGKFSIFATLNRIL